MKELFFRYVPHAEVHKYLQNGWTAHKGLNGTHHGVYSVLMQWTGTGEPPCNKIDSSTKDTKMRTAEAG